MRNYLFEQTYAKHVQIPATPTFLCVETRVYY